MPRKIKIDSIGKTFEFPDGTPDAVIDKAVREEILPHYQQQAAPQSPSVPSENQTPQQPSQPSFSTMFGRTMGAPTTPEEAGGMLTGKSGVMEGAADSPFNPQGGVNLPNGFNPGSTAKNVLTNMGNSIARGVKGGAQQFSEAVDNVKHGGPILSNIGKAASGYADILSSVNPVINSGGESGKEFAKGNVPGGLGAFAAGMIQGGAMGRSMGKPTAPPSPSALFDEMRVAPQRRAFPELAKVPANEIAGLEDIYRAAAPTGKNQGFRANLHAALPDLKAVAADLNLKESSGGIISPDMRVRATVDALNTRLDSIYTNERLAQVQRNAGTPVEIKLNTDARRGMEFLAANAGESGTQQLASSALKRGALPMEQADILAQAANKYLKGYEKLPSEQKMSMQMTNSKIGGLKELDRSLGSSLNKTLTDAGEVGLRDYERRYAGVSAVRDALQDRMNAAELKQEGAMGAVGRVTRPAAKLITGGKSGIASASQAAVADVNIGKQLQSGFKKLSAGKQ